MQRDNPGRQGGKGRCRDARLGDKDEKVVKAAITKTDKAGQRSCRDKPGRQGSRGTEGGEHDRRQGSKGTEGSVTGDKAARAARAARGARAARAARQQQGRKGQKGQRGQQGQQGQRSCREARARDKAAGAAIIQQRTQRNRASERARARARARERETERERDRDREREREGGETEAAGAKAVIMQGAKGQETKEHKSKKISNRTCCLMGVPLLPLAILAETQILEARLLPGPLSSCLCSPFLFVVCLLLSLVALAS